MAQDGPRTAQDGSGWTQDGSGRVRSKSGRAEDSALHITLFHVPGSFLLPSCHVLSHPEFILSHPESSWDILRKRTFCDGGRAHRPA